MEWKDRFDRRREAFLELLRGSMKEDAEHLLTRIAAALDALNSTRERLPYQRDVAERLRKLTTLVEQLRMSVTAAEFQKIQSVYYTLQDSVGEGIGNKSHHFW